MGQFGLEIESDLMCPRSSDPFYVVTYFINGSLLLGHVVFYFTGVYIPGFF